MALLLSIVCRFGLRLKGATQSLATGKLQYVVRDRRSFGPSFWAWFNVDIGHIRILVEGFTAITNILTTAVVVLHSPSPNVLMLARVDPHNAHQDQRSCQGPL